MLEIITIALVFGAGAATILLFWLALRLNS